MTRELTSIEQDMAESLCDIRFARDESHGEYGIEPVCERCRADIVRLVDASPSETPFAPGIVAVAPSEHVEHPDGSATTTHHLLVNGPDSAPPAGDGVPRVTELEIEELDERLANANPTYRKTILDCVSYCATRQGEGR